MVKLKEDSILLAECKILPWNGGCWEDVMKAIHDKWDDFPLVSDLEENPELPDRLDLAQNVTLNNGCFRSLLSVDDGRLVVSLLYFVPEQNASFSVMKGFAAVTAYKLDQPCVLVVPSLEKKDFFDTLTEEFGFHVKAKGGNSKLKTEKEYHLVLEAEEGVVVMNCEFNMYADIEVCKVYHLFLFSKNDFCKTTETPRLFSPVFTLDF